MTSDAQRYEELQGEDLAVMPVAQQPEQVIGVDSADTGKALSHSGAPLAVTVENIHIPAVLRRDNESMPARDFADPQVVLESLEQDLAELASVCSGYEGAAPNRPGTIEPMEEPMGPLSVSSSPQPQPQPQPQPVAHSLDSHAQHFPSHYQMPHEEPFTVNVQVKPVFSDATDARGAVAAVETVRQPPALETDGVLHEVQSTLDSLAGMASELSQQKLDIVRVREELEERRLATVERERQLAEREERLSQLEQRLQEDKQGIERIAEQNGAVLAERSNVLQALADSVESRDRATSKRAEALNQQQQIIEHQQNQLRVRAHELDHREAGLQRQSAELADRFKQLIDAKERFGSIVKGFNETVRFNTSYSAISKTVKDET